VAKSAKREIDHSKRDIDREVREIERNEKALISKIKMAHKNGNEVRIRLSKHPFDINNYKYTSIRPKCDNIQGN
jgi:hypothetical protein